MRFSPPLSKAPLAVAALLACCLAPGAAFAADGAAKSSAKPAAKSAKPSSRAARKAPASVEPKIEDATPEQGKAAEMVYYGVYDCEFQQTVSISQSPKHASYVEVKAAKGLWLMRPVLSSTGAIRLEDVRGETLMVQIASKSMLLNVKSAQRIVDDCVSPKQRELIAEAKAAKAAAEAAAANGGPAPANANPLLGTETQATK